MDDQPNGFITLPPGLVYSGTFKRDRVEPAVLSEREEIVFFPAAPGVVAAPVWALALPDDTEVVVDGKLLLGRDPSTAGHPGAETLAVQDSTKSVSKTHALLEVDGGALWVHDLDSTNGVWVAAAGSDPIEVEPGIRVIVADGGRVELGDFVIRVTHGTSGSLI